MVRMGWLSWLAMVLVRKLCRRDPCVDAVARKRRLNVTVTSILRRAITVSRTANDADNWKETMMDYDAIYYGAVGWKELPVTSRSGAR